MRICIQKGGKQDILGVMPPTDADVDNLIITMESGTFEEVVVIVPTTTSNGWTFRMPQNFYSTPCMLVDSLIIQRRIDQVDKDSLRATIRIEAERPFDASSNTLTLSIDQKELQIGPNDWTKKDKKNQKLSYIEKNGKEKISLKLDTVKRKISLRWTNTNLSAGVISNAPLIRVAYGGFDKSNILGLSVKTKKAKETLWY